MSAIIILFTITICSDSHGNPALRHCDREGRFKLRGVCSRFAGLHRTGATVAETESLIREAIEFHLEGLKKDGLPIPPPSSQVEYVDVPA